MAMSLHSVVSSSGFVCEGAQMWSPLQGEPRTVVPTPLGAHLALVRGLTEACWSLRAPLWAGLWGSASASDFVLPIPIKQAWEQVCLGCLSSLQTWAFLASQQTRLTFPVSMGTESDCSQTTN